MIHVNNNQISYLGTTHYEKGNKTGNKPLKGIVLEDSLERDEEALV